jgi:hypothetical protein
MNFKAGDLVQLDIILEMMCNPHCYRELGIITNVYTRSNTVRVLTRNGTTISPTKFVKKLVQCDD